MQKSNPNKTSNLSMNKKISLKVEKPDVVFSETNKHGLWNKVSTGRAFTNKCDLILKLEKGSLQSV